MSTVSKALLKSKNFPWVMLISEKLIKITWSYRTLSLLTLGCIKGEAAITAPKCSQLQVGRSEPVALRPSS